MVRFRLTLVILSGLWLAPSSLFAQDLNDLSSCKVYQSALLAGRAARGRVALLRVSRRGGADRLRRAAVFRRLHRDPEEEGFRQRPRQRRLRVGRHPHCRRPRRVQHPHEDRHVLQRRRHDEPRRPRRSQHVRHPGARRLLPWRRAAQGRSQEVPDRQRRLQHLRAADAALGDLVGLVHRQPRRLRAAAECGVPGQGRPADVPAGVLLPDSGRRPRHRLPDADLRLGDAAGTDAQQLLFLGDQPQPRRDRVPRLDDEGRAAGRRRVPLRPRAGVAGQRAGPLAGGEGNRNDAPGRDGARPESAAQLRRQR